MTNTLLKNKESVSSFRPDLQRNIYLLPKWEKIKSVSCSKNVLFFMKKSFNENLFKKFSLKNKIEKYEVKDEKGKVDARMDLKVYKDSVYIIDLDIKPEKFDGVLAILLQAAAEKAMYNTTDKKVYLNLSMKFSVKSKIKKMIKKFGYVASLQSEYEKQILGEEFVLDLKSGSCLNSLLKCSHYYLNK